MQFAIVIMAAGKGTRLKTKRPKVLHEVGGKTLLRHVVDAARQIVPPEDIYVIVGHEAELVKASLSGLGVEFVDQREQRGTGHAIQEARAGGGGICRLDRAIRRCPADPAGNDQEGTRFPPEAEGGHDGTDGRARAICMATDG